MTELSPQEQQRLCARLEANHSFPGPYTYKVVVESGAMDDRQLRDCVAAVDGAAVEDVTLKESRKGNYHSFTVVIQADHSLAVALVYKVFSEHESVKFLL